MFIIMKNELKQSYLKKDDIAAATDKASKRILQFIFAQ